MGSESIGRGDETLGFEILVNLLETLSKRDDGPAAIICWNMAVKLLAEGSPSLSHFKRLEENGVKLLAGQLRNVVGEVCDHCSHTDEAENAHRGSLLYSHLGRVVDPGGLHLLIHAPLYPLHKSLSHRSHLGD